MMSKPNECIWLYKLGFVFLFVGSAALSQPDLNRNYEQGKVEGSIRYKEISTYGCESGAKKWAQTAFNFGEIIQLIINSSELDSSQRKSKLDLLRKMRDEITDRDYLELKKAKQSYVSKITDTDYMDRAIKIQNADILFRAFEDAREIAFIMANKNPGKSETTYQRLIEDECLRWRQ